MKILMFIIGLDLSINYSSYTIFDTETKEYHFGSIINNPYISKKAINYLSDLSLSIEGFKVAFTNSSGEKNSIHKLDYIDCERCKLLNYLEISKKLCDEINLITKKSSDVILGVEGFSYGSQGDSVFDVPTLTGIIRYDVLYKLLGFDINKFFVFSPSDLKKSFDCKGNCDKSIIFREFINNPKSEIIKTSGFYKFISENQNDTSVSNVNSKGKLVIESPFNDIIDSYLSVHKILKNINAGV